MKRYNIAVVGATGMVGGKMLQVLKERGLPVENYYAFASSKSAGKRLPFLGSELVVEELTETCFDGKDIDIALFSAGGGTSEHYSPFAAKAGAVVIDNSSAWRMDEAVPLVVPEVNAQDIALYKNKGIIANPNCSTIQAVVALAPIHRAYGIERIVYSTYQAVSGAGVKGYNDLKNAAGEGSLEKFPYQIAGNCLPHIDVFLDNGYTKEEMKMVNETHKILGDDSIAITATTVRVPVFFGHSESINVQTKRPFDLAEVKELLANAPGIIMHDDPQNGVYPMPIVAEDKDEVFVGRVRRDFSIENGMNLWVVADNIRKGAATNAVQIAQALIAKWESGEIVK